MCPPQPRVSFLRRRVSVTGSWVQVWVRPPAPCLFSKASPSRSAAAAGSAKPGAPTARGVRTSVQVGSGGRRHDSAYLVSGEFSSVSSHFPPSPPSVAFKEICPAGPGYQYSPSTLKFNQRVSEPEGGGAVLVNGSNKENQGT